MKSKKNILVLTGPIDAVSKKFLDSFIKIIEKRFSDVTLIAPNYINHKLNEEIEIINFRGSIDKKNNESITEYLKINIRIILKILRDRESKLAIVFMGQSLFLQILFLRILRKKVVLILGTSYNKLKETRKDCETKLLAIFEKMSLFLSNNIIVYSENLIKEWKFDRYKPKIATCSRHYLDFEKFYPKKEFDQRKNIIGFFGRFSEEKAPLNFIDSINKIQFDNVEFLICGDGKLKETIKKRIEKNGIKNKIKVINWIPHDKMPDFLNKIKIIVIPSYCEGLPNIMIEAMACGTIVLANPVGSIPDFINDKGNGFLLKNNSPHCISKNIDYILKSSKKKVISENAIKTANKYFSF